MHNYVKIHNKQKEYIMIKQKNTSLCGAHMSVAGGLHHAIKDGESIGCTAIQIFTKNNRQWYATKITESQATLFKEEYKKSSIQIIVAHASYLINLGASDTTVLEKSIKALKEELLRCDALEIPYLILHPGSGKTHNKKQTIHQIGASIHAIMQELPMLKTTLLLENSAGQGNHVGSSFEELADIIATANVPSNIGACLDTCHAFSAGYDLRTFDYYNNMIEIFDKTIGLNRLKTIHVNDSKKPLGSNVDRHEEIGKGLIGLSVFSFIMNDKRLINVPKILEIPNEALIDHERNLNVLLSLINRH